MSLTRMNLGAAGRGRLAEYAYDRIKAALLDGQYRPGDRLSVEDLVGQLATSRQPVMDALKRLASDGFVEIIPQVGCRVVALDRQGIADFFRLFAAAEGLTAELAASRRREEELLLLEMISAQIGALRHANLTAEQEAHSYRLLNRGFHGQVHAMAHSTTVGQLAQSLWDRSDFYISTAVGRILFAVRLAEAHDEHEQVRQAIVARDGPTARQAMEQHVLNFARQIEAQPEEPSARAG